MARFIFFVVVALVECCWRPAPASCSRAERTHVTIAPEDLLSKYDHKLQQFSEYFAQSSTGKFLQEILEDLARHPATKFGVGINSAAALRQPVYYPQRIPVTRAYRSPLEGLPTGSPQQQSVALMAYISTLTILALIPFSFLAVFGAAPNLVVYTWCAIIGYAAGTLTLMLLFGLIANWIVCICSLAFGGLAAYFSHARPTKQLAYSITFFACLLAGNTIYGLLAGLPLPQISPAFCGLAGLIFDTGFAGKRYEVLKLLYLAFVAVLAALLYLTIPSYVLGKEPQNAQEREFATTCTRYIVCFICAWVVSGGIMQLFYLLGAAFNPLDPASTFYIPTQLRLDTWETYVALSIWALLTYVFAYLRQKYEQDSRFDPELVSREVREQWRRLTSQ